MLILMNSSYTKGYFSVFISLLSVWIRISVFEREALLWQNETFTEELRFDLSD